MTKQALFSLSVVLISLFHCSTILAQPAAAPVSPTKPPPQPAQAPVQPAQPPVQSIQVPPQPGRKDVISILGKAGQYSVFIRLLKSTGVADQLKGQLKNKKIGFTLFAPTDNAFSNLKAGTLNSLSDLQKTQLVQYHVLSNLVSLSNFQTLSNPVPTEAGDTTAGQFPLNLTTAGSQVNISTGLVNTTLGGTVYSDNQLAIYQVDKVLLPQDIFAPKPPAPAKAPSPSKSKSKSKPDEVDSDEPKPKPTKTTAETPSASTASTVNASGAVTLTGHGVWVSVGVAVIAFFVTKGTQLLDDI